MRSMASPSTCAFCERTRVVSSGLGSPGVSFSTHFAFLSGSNILGSIAGSPQASSQNFQLFTRSLLYSWRSRCIDIFQLRGAKEPYFQLFSVTHEILLRKEASESWTVGLRSTNRTQY